LRLLCDALASEYAYLPVDVAQIPYEEFVTDFARSHCRRTLHNYGAMQALERLLDLLQDGGFILVNDYGPTQIEPNYEGEHQHFSQATCIGLNFPLLEAYFGDGGRCEWIQPTVERETIHARLLGRYLAPETQGAFLEHFGKGSFDQE